MSLFPRYFRPGVSATLAGTTAKNLGLPPPAPKGPRITFRVRKTMASTPDRATVSIYNLAPERTAAMSTLFGATGRTPLIIAGGYDGVLSRLFLGDVRSLDTDRQAGPSDTMLVAQADDGGDALANVSVSYSTAGWTAGDMIDVALLAFATNGYPIAKHPTVGAAVAAVTASATVSFYAAAHVGRASQLLDEAARLLGVRWWVRDSQLFMVKRGAPVDTIATVLPKTHLLDTPSFDGSGLLRTTALFDPNILPGRLVALQGRIAPGSLEPYRVEATDHSGDTHGGRAWSVAMTLRKPTI